jgi:hypothetical protein
MADAVQTLGLDISEFERSLRDAQASLSKGAERSIRSAQRALAVAVREQASANRAAAEAQRAAAQAAQVELREQVRLQREAAEEARKAAALAAASAEAGGQLAAIAARRTEEEALTHAYQRQVAQIKELIEVSGDHATGARALAVAAEEHRVALEGVQRQGAGAAKSTWMLTQQTASLRRNLGDVANSLLAGASPFTVLAQQGPQVLEILADAEDATSLLKSSFGGLVGRVAALAAPLAAVAAVLAVVGTTAVAMANAFEMANPQLYEVRQRMDGVRAAADAVSASMGRLAQPTRDAAAAARAAQEDLGVLVGTLDRYTVAEQRAHAEVDARVKPTLEAAAADLAATEANLLLERQLLQTVGAYQAERQAARERIGVLEAQAASIRGTIDSLRESTATEKEAISASAEYQRELADQAERERRAEEARRRATEALQRQRAAMQAAAEEAQRYARGLAEAEAVFAAYAAADAAASAQAVASQREVLRLTADTTGALEDRLAVIEAEAQAQIEGARERLAILVEVGRAEEAAQLLAAQTAAIRAAAAKRAAEEEAKAARAADGLGVSWASVESAVGGAARELSTVLPSMRELASSGMAAARGLGQALGQVAGPGLQAVTSVDGALQALSGQVEAEAAAVESVRTARRELREAVASGDAGAIDEARAALRTARGELEAAQPQAFIRGLIGGATAMVRGMVDALPGFVRGLTKAAPRLITAIVDGIPDMVRAIIRAAPQIAISLATAFAVELPVQLIAELPAIARALALGIGEAFVAAGKRIRRVIGDALREIATGGRADTRTFGDTPGPQRVGPRGARVSPGDYVVAARSMEGLRSQVAGSRRDEEPQVQRLVLDVRDGPVALGIATAASRAMPQGMVAQRSPWRR